MLKNKSKLKMLETSFSLKAKLWKYDGPAGWCFVTIPKSMSKRIRVIHQSSEEGWGRLKASISIGNSTWKTSIWFDTKRSAYLLPIKTSIRKNENLNIGSTISAQIEFDLDCWILGKV